LLQCVWQQELLPNEHYRQLWQQLRAQFDPYQAARLMVEALYTAVQDKQMAVAAYMEAQLLAGTLTLLALQRHFHLCESSNSSHFALSNTLISYDQLLPMPVPSISINPNAALPCCSNPQTLAHTDIVAVLEGAIASGWSHSQFLLALCEYEET